MNSCHLSNRQQKACEVFLCIFFSYLHCFCSNGVHLQDYLTVGRDHFYHQERDYLVNDVAPLGGGEFGTFVMGQDKATESVFTIKRNNRDDKDKTDLIRHECNTLARLHGHENIVQFFGAVIDEDERQYPPRVCKMFMEFAESERHLVLSFLVWGKALTYDVLLHWIPCRQLAWLSL